MAEGVTEAYEQLRPHLLDLSDMNGSPRSNYPERVILLRRGMLSWAHEHTPAMTSARIDPTFAVVVPSPECGSPATELVRLMASLILSSTKEPCYARTESLPLPSGA